MTETTNNDTKPEITDEETVNEINGRMQRIWELEIEKVSKTAEIDKAIRKLQAAKTEVEEPFNDEQTALRADIEAIILASEAKCTTDYGDVLHYAGYRKVTYNAKGLDEFLQLNPDPLIEQFRKSSFVNPRVEIKLKAIPIVYV